MIFIPHLWLVTIFTAVAAWKAWQYLRSRDAALLAVVGVFSLLAAGYALGECAERHCWAQLTPMQFELAGTILIMASKYCIATFFIMASRRIDDMKRILALTAVPFLVAITILATSTVAAGPGARPFQFTDRAVLMFYIGEKVFTVAIGVVILYYCVAYLKLLSDTPARGIALAAVGALLMLAASLTFSAQLGFYALHSKPPRPLVIAGRWEIYVGQLVFVLGISWYGLVMRLRACVTLLAALRDVITLRPMSRLAAAVLAQFLPNRPTPVFRLAHPVTSILDRRHAAMVDIRDALMLLSPQFDPALTSTEGEFVEEFCRVSTDNLRHPILYGEPMRAVIDHADTFDSDRKLLTSLAFTLRRHRGRIPTGRMHAKSQVAS